MPNNPKTELADKRDIMKKVKYVNFITRLR